MTAPGSDTPSKGPSTRTPGILLGLGLGGFVDGILLHQILQWHHMVSGVEGRAPNNLANLELNVTADGLFHAATWILVLAGVLVLGEVMRSGRGSGPPRRLVGWVAVGWGAFNIVEGLVNHHILQIHRVRPEAANPLVYDIGFLVLGAVLIVGGLALQRVGPDRAAER